jgi:hypothetical protein
MRKPDPVDLVHVYIPVLVEAAVAAYAFGIALIWVGILAGRI